MAPILIAFGVHLSDIFSIFHNTPNIAILQQVPCQTLTCSFQALSFGDHFSIKNLFVFWFRFWTHCFHHFSKIVTQSHDLGTPFGIQFGSKWRAKTAKWRQTTSIFIFTVVPRCAPLFSRNHSDYCAVGAWGLSKVILFDGDWSIFIFSAFL